MTQTWTTPRTPDTVISMDGLDQNRDDDDHVWSRFWVGIGCVLIFAITSTLLVIAIGGPHAGASYGLVVLIVTLLAGTIDGVVLLRRRSR